MHWPSAHHISRPSASFPPSSPPSFFLLFLEVTFPSVHLLDRSVLLVARPSVPSLNSLQVTTSAFPSRTNTHAGGLIPRTFRRLLDIVLSSLGFSFLFVFPVSVTLVLSLSLSCSHSTMSLSRSGSTLDNHSLAQSSMLNTRTLSQHSMLNVQRSALSSTLQHSHQHSKLSDLVNAQCSALLLWRSRSMLTDALARRSMMLSIHARYSILNVLA